MDQLIDRLVTDLYWKVVGRIKPAICSGLQWSFSRLGNQSVSHRTRLWRLKAVLRQVFT